MNNIKQWKLVLVFFFSVIWPQINAQDKDPELEKLVRLRQARRFDEVQREVRRMTANLGDREFAKRVLLQVELLKAKTAEAFEMKPAGRIDSYQSILQTADRFIQDQSTNPNLVLMEVQKSVTTLKFGELIRKEIEAGVLRPGNSKVAFQLLRDADRQFASIDKQLNSMIPRRPRKSQDGSLTQRQLISLQNQVRYQQIKSKINRGLMYGEDDPDNLVAVLTTAKSDLQKVIPQIEKVDSAWWESRLDLLMILRSIAEFREAEGFFKSIPVREAPPKVKLAFKAEMVRLALDKNELDKAQDLISSGREIDGEDLPDFDYAILEFFLRKKELADARDKREIQDTLVKIVQAIEKKHGAYWGRRSNMALVKSAKIFGASGSTTLIRVAQDHYRKQEFTESIAEFEKAAAAARKELNRKLELELRFQAIVIHRDLGQLQQVFVKSRDLGKEFRDTKRAAVVHLIGILSAAELTRMGKIELADYLQMIDFHLNNWEGHPTIGKVARFRGDYAAAKGSHFEAALNYQASIHALVQPSGAIDLDEFESSISKLSLALRNISRPDSDKPKLKEFIERFDGKDFFSVVEAKTSSLESLLNCWAAYALEIDSTELPAVLNRLAKEPKPQKETLVNWVRVAVMTQRVDALTDVKQKLASMSAPDTRLLLVGLARDWNRASAAQRRDLAKLILQLDIDDRQADEFWSLITQALLVSQRQAEAISILQGIQSRKPKLLKARLILADLLSVSDDEEKLRRSLDVSRRILRDTKPNSDPWFSAKFFIATAHFRLGDYKSAAAVLELMKAIPPGWNQCKRKSEFDRLYANVLAKKAR